MAEPIKFFGRDVTLREADGGWHIAELAPGLQLRWGAGELALMVGSHRVSPTAGDRDGVQRAAEVLESIFRPMRALFRVTIVELQEGEEPRPAPDQRFAGPVPMALHCPKCSTEHIDLDEWATKPHRTHLCQKPDCQHEWRPCDFYTVGVAAGEDEADVSYFNGGHDGPGWYYWDSQYKDEGSVGAFESFEDAARHAALSYHRVLPPLIARPA